jgi:DNA polymerase III subunit epsilon
MGSFIAIDFETAQGPRHTACAVGIVKVIDNTIVEKYFTLIKPPDNKHSPGNSRKNGINSTHTINAPTFPEVVDKIHSYLKDNKVVCYSQFDENVYNSCVDYYNLDEYYYVRNFTDVCYLDGGRSLDKACAAYGIEFKHHDALSDAYACARVYLIRMKNVINDYENTYEPVFYKPEGYSKFTGELLVKDLMNVYDKNNAFFDKKVVISGIFKNWPNRNDLGVILKKLGADVDTSIGKNTNYLITGENAGPSKINKMKLKMQVSDDAFILTEDEVSKMLDTNIIDYYEYEDGTVNYTLLKYSDSVINYLSYSGSKYDIELPLS